MPYSFSAVTPDVVGFPVVPPVQPSSLAIKDVSTHGVIPLLSDGKIMGDSKKPMVRILLAVPAPIGTREALGATRLNLVQKGLALKSWKPFKKGMFVYKNKSCSVIQHVCLQKQAILSLCFGRKSFSSTIKKTKMACSLRDPYEDGPYGLSDTCLRSNLPVPNYSKLHVDSSLPGNYGFVFSLVKDSNSASLTLKLTWRFGWDVGWNWKLQMLVIPLLFDSPKQRPLFIT